MAELSAGDKRMLNSIETYGWHVIKVMEDEIGPGFGYSIGLFKTFGHPEVIIIGLKLDLIHAIINDIGEDIKNGKKYESGAFYSDIIEGFDCYFVSVDNRYYHDYVGRAQWFYENDDFPLIQCIYPTKKNIYPWQSEWPEEIASLQPILTNSKIPGSNETDITK